MMNTSFLFFFLVTTQFPLLITTAKCIVLKQCLQTERKRTATAAAAACTTEQQLVAQLRLVQPAGYCPPPNGVSETYHHHAINASLQGRALSPHFHCFAE